MYSVALYDEDGIYAQLIKQNPKDQNILEKIKGKKVLSSCFTSFDVNGKTILSIPSSIKYFIFIQGKSIDVSIDVDSEEIFFIYGFEEIFAFGRLALQGLLKNLKNLPKYLPRRELEIVKPIEVIELFETACENAHIPVEHKKEVNIVFKNFDYEKSSIPPLSENMTISFKQFVTLQDIVAKMGSLYKEGKCYFNSKDHRNIISDKKADEVDFSPYLVSYVREHFCAIIMDYYNNDQFFKDQSHKNENIELARKNYESGMKSVVKSLRESRVKYYIIGCDATEKQYTLVSHLVSHDESTLSTLGSEKSKVLDIFNSVFGNTTLEFIFLVAHNQGGKIALPLYNVYHEHCIDVRQDIIKRKTCLSHIKELELFFCYSAKSVTLDFLKAGVKSCNFNVGADQSGSMFYVLERLLEKLKLPTTKLAEDGK
jgi:ribosomal protein L7Ae-like RNA K-turn-binding protein